MIADAKMVANVLQSCEKALCERGFRRLRKDGIVFEISKSFLGWIGLNVGKHREMVRINPFIGVHCVPLMELLAKLADEKYQLGRYATFSASLGDIDERYRSFEFKVDSDVRAVSDMLADAIREKGIPYMNSCANLPTLIGLLASRAATLGGYPQRAAAAIYLEYGAAKFGEKMAKIRAENRSDSLVQEVLDQFEDAMIKHGLLSDGEKRKCR